MSEKVPILLDDVCVCVKGAEIIVRLTENSSGFALQAMRLILLISSLPILIHCDQALSEVLKKKKRRKRKKRTFRTRKHHTTQEAGGVWLFIAATPKHHGERTTNGRQLRRRSR